MPDEPNQTIDVRNNRESRAASSNAPSSVARASDGGAPPRDAPEAGELPEAVEDGTAAGSPVAGLEISAEDAKTAVKGDMKSEQLGQKGPNLGG
jgi:hypothetical protein